jgi:hypothetical protein
MVKNCFCTLLCFILLVFSAKADDLTAFSSIFPAHNSNETCTDRTLEFPIRCSSTCLQNITQSSYPQTIPYNNAQSSALSKFNSPHQPSVSRVFLRI